jgi:Fe2+ or Zn2+ uptake regulation protein
MTNADLDALVEALSEYLRRNPQACDTLDGIASWWLGGEWSQRPALVQEALDRLEELGVIERVRAGDGRVRYRRRANGGRGPHAAPPRRPSGRGVH